MAGKMRSEVDRILGEMMMTSPLTLRSLTEGERVPIQNPGEAIAEALLMVKGLAIATAELATEIDNIRAVLGLEDE